MRGTLRLGVFATALFAAGCGAKTGLLLPDAHVDASGDLGPDAMDAGVDMNVPCIEVPPDAGIIRLDIATSSRLQRADVLFLIDVTASMTGEIDQVQARLRDTIAPALSAEIPDVAFGVATFADYPTSSYGSPGDVLFALHQPMTTDLATVQGALDGVHLQSGNDPPEGQVEALYEVATGSGQSGFMCDGAGRPTTTPIPPPWVGASFGCPHGGFGYPCFRNDSLPLVFMFTDAAFHESPSGGRDYSICGTTPHTYIQARDALTHEDIRVIGFWSGDDGGATGLDLRSIVTDTGALSGTGTPLVFDIGGDGERLDTSVVAAIQAFAEGVTLDIDAIAIDPVPDDGIDARALIRAIVPTMAVPMTGITGVDLATNTFLGVKSGTRVFFRLEIQSDVIPPGPVPQEVLVDIAFRGNGRSDLGRTRIRLVIPARDGMGCPPGSTMEVPLSGP